MNEPTKAINNALDRATTWLHANTAHVNVVQCALVGSHLYGFASHDSDLDLKGMFAATPAQLLGVRGPAATINRIDPADSIEYDLTLNELAGALRLLAGGNGNMLERLHSPWQLGDAETHQQLLELSTHAVSVRCAAHYQGFLAGCRREHEKKQQAKTLLYCYRVALTGIHLLNTGRVECHLPTLAEQHGCDQVDELIAAKTAGEHAPLPTAVSDAHLRHIDTLASKLEQAKHDSHLPAAGDIEPLDRWLVSWRLEHLTR